jgi:NADH:ubiquinone oxidoreductase subunit 6 (subunit J)
MTDFMSIHNLARTPPFKNTLLPARGVIIMLMVKQPMTKQPQSKKPRPYWHVDLKWIFGILALFAIAGSLLLYNLSALTEREKATTLSATVVASLFSKNGLDDPKGLEEFRAKAAASPGDKVTPIEQFPWLSISKQEAMTLGPKELRIAIFKQFTEPIYDKGLKGAAAGMTADPAEQQKFIQQASLLGVFTKDTHDAIGRALVWVTIAAILFLAAVIYFSAGWGRLVSPAVLLLAVSPVGAVAGLLFLYPPKDGDGPLTSLPPSVTTEIGNSLSHTYLIAVIAGITLLIAAVIGKITQKNIRKNRA